MKPSFCLLDLSETLVLLSVILLQLFQLVLAAGCPLDDWLEGLPCSFRTSTLQENTGQTMVDGDL